MTERLTLTHLLTDEKSRLDRLNISAREVLTEVGNIEMHAWGRSAIYSKCMCRSRSYDLFIDPNLIIPAPEIHGKLTAVHIEGDNIIQVYGGGRAGRSRSLVPYDRKAASYMYFRGGTIRFGKLTRTNADMQIVDAHPEDPFDFSIDHYNRQLAGYSKNTPRYGLVVFMPDY